jgi:hypothetical protein
LLEYAEKLTTTPTTAKSDKNLINFDFDFENNTRNSLEVKN